jgi:hypothetical protein
VIVFIGEFIPQIGAYISAAIIIAFLTRGWQIGLIAAIFCTVVNAGKEMPVDNASLSFLACLSLVPMHDAVMPDLLPTILDHLVLSGPMC